MKRTIAVREDLAETPDWMVKKKCPHKAKYLSRQADPAQGHHRQGEAQRPDGRTPSWPTTRPGCARAASCSPRRCSRPT